MSNIKKLDFTLNNVRPGSSEHAIAETLILIGQKLNEVIEVVNKLPDPIRKAPHD